MVFLQIICRTATISAQGCKWPVCWHYTVSKRSGVKWPWQRDTGSRLWPTRVFSSQTVTYSHSQQRGHTHAWRMREYTIHQQFSIISIAYGRLQLFSLLAGCEYTKVEENASEPMF